MDGKTEEIRKDSDYLFQPGQSGNPSGRPAGIPNKSTTLAREAIARFVDDGAPLLWDWLKRIAEDSPKAAFDAYMSVLEYHVPKLQRQEIHMTGQVQLEQLILDRTPREKVVEHVPSAKAIDVIE